MTTTIDREQGPAAADERARPGAAARTTLGRRRPQPVETAMPAGRALQIMLGALLVAMVFNSAAMVRAGEAMAPGLTRSLVLAVAHPVHAVAHTLWLDRPRRVLGWAFRSGGAAHSSSPLLTAPQPTSASGPASEGSAPALAGADSPTGSAESAAASAPATRVVTAAEPLRLLVTGDSMTEFVGPAVIKATSPGSKVVGQTVTHYGTGLVRPDFFDWSREAERLVKTGSPEAVVVMIGGNEGQGIRMPAGGAARDGSPAWTAEYQRRAGIIMRILTAGGARRVYWVGMPVARSPRLAKDYAQLNRAVAAAAVAVPGVRYVEVATRLSADGHYAAYLPDDAGHTVLARARDGIHLSRDGARIAAAIVVRALDADWHLAGG